MATVNIGKIKFNWKGAYAAGTAYVVDDVVESAGSSYVCILASTGNTPPNATYWELMADKGTDTSVATTQGDVLYHNGTSLARLGAGTSGQLLETGGTGANPSWTDAPVGGLVQTKYYILQDSFSVNNTSMADLGNFSLTITPTSASNKILLSVHFGSLIGSTNNGNNTTAFQFTRNGTAIGNANGDGNRVGYVFRSPFPDNSNHADTVSFTYIDAPSSTSALTYKVQNRNETSNLFIGRNENFTNDGNTYNAIYTSVFIAQEIVA